ncbi:MAG TPA: S8 family serine peptidase, partial [Puia sp.]|nr:S8 family serine peptidase [Puia sp.]
MKNVYFLIFVICLSINNLIAQKLPRAIHFKNGDFTGNRNLQKGKLAKDFLAGSEYHHKIYALVQFDKIPDVNDKKELAAAGIRLFEYLPGNAFLTELPERFSHDSLKTYHATGIFNINSQLKISTKLGPITQAHFNDPDYVIAISYFGSLSKPDVIKELERAGADILQTKIQPERIIFIKGSSLTINKIASLPFVSSINEQALKDIPLNYNNRAIHAVNALASSSGRNLQGNNVTVGVGDNADPSTHIDFTGRLINRNPNWTAGHGTHTTGTTGGGGILNPKYKGMAPMSTLISQNFSDILVNAPVYMNDYSMVLTNNSYYSGANGCPGEGQYDALSNYVDGQIIQYDSLLHVFASGNDGALACTPYPTSFATIKSGFQCGKNVITVGAISNVTYKIAGFSSCGPVGDGRIKPEIVAGGVNITSTLANNSYGLDNGTSMAAPTVTGTLALLYQRYKQLHSGSNPSAALIKAVACNSADDLGNPGPDYNYGFGMLNARTAVETIENNQYFSGTINNSANVTYKINGLSAGVQQLKIMLYWNDPASSLNAASALVNNLDLTVTEPNGTVTHHPLILNPNPAHVHDNAVEGIDSINNVEQVVIDNPAAGNFTVTVNGTNVPAGPQNFIVAYEIINPSVTV